MCTKAQDVPFYFDGNDSINFFVFVIEGNGAGNLQGHLQAPFFFFFFNFGSPGGRLHPTPLPDTAEFFLGDSKRNGWEMSSG